MTELLEISAFESIFVDQLTFTQRDGDTPEWGLGAQALMSDPWFYMDGVYQIQGLPESGLFLHLSIGKRNLWIHESRFEEMYRIKGFAVERKFYCSRSACSSPVKAQTQAIAAPKRAVGEEQLSPKTKREVETVVNSVLADSSRAVSSQWGDVEDYDPMDLNQVPPSDSSKMKKLNDLIMKRIEELPTLDQLWVPFCDYAKGRNIKERKFYLFDFVASFIEPGSLFQDKNDFHFSKIEEKLNLLNTMDPNCQISLNSEDSGWNTQVRFLCQSLPGELQVPFFKVALFYSVRKVATPKRIKDAQRLSSEMQSFFLLGDKSIREDMSRVVHLNYKAFQNNRKILIDKNYIEHLALVVD